ncbi:hypothetical protein PRIPAC_89062 [Pristionchus pacificus]|uniref:Zinc finger protein n=1 Tax=Pristionchus pacificus TaxID=54126 RepID=A0A2A6CXN3_PRIPA|nr:hypothetical protein PRIPAC_89062 [Pristionchus pacificus]|eukprot:PDM82846.1 zinc finger protein [Pristionchus pacificus]
MRMTLYVKFRILLDDRIAGSVGKAAHMIKVMIQRYPDTEVCCIDIAIRVSLTIKLQVLKLCDSLEKKSLSLLHEDESRKPPSPEMIRKIKPTISGKFECEICKKLYKSVKILRQHRRIHLPSYISKKEKRFKCEKCEKIYSTAYSLSLHAQSHLSAIEEKRPYKCGSCEKRFSSPSNLKNPQKTHLPLNDPSRLKFKCEICEKMFTRNENFMCHKRSHKETGPFKCGFCKRVFSIYRALCFHESVAHNLTYKIVKKMIKSELEDEKNVKIEE